jgi:hypothetical protein
VYQRVPDLPEHGLLLQQMPEARQNAALAVIEASLAAAGYGRPGRPCG